MRTDFRPLLPYATKDLMIKKRMKSSILLAGQLLVSSGLLFLIFSIVPFAQTLKTLESTKIEIVMIAVLVSMAMRFINAYQMTILTDCQRMGLSCSRIFQINLMTTFYGLFLPTYVVGGPIRWYKLSQHNKMRAEALAAIVFNRFISIFTLIVIGLACWIWDGQHHDSTIRGWALGVLIGLLILLGATLAKNNFFALIGPNLQKIKMSILPEMFRGAAQKVLQAFGQFQTLTFVTKLQILGYSFLYQVLGVINVFLLGMALVLPLSPLTLGWIRSWLGVVTLIPISIAGLGIREGSLAIFLQPYGIALNEAVALALLIFLMPILWGTIGGILEARKLLIGDKKRSTTKQFAQ